MPETAIKPTPAPAIRTSRKGIRKAKADFRDLGAEWSWWIRTAADLKAAVDGCRPDKHAGELVTQFFETLLTHGMDRWSGQPFRLEPWERDINLRLFGWKRPDGRRRFRRAYIAVGKKNGKSALGSGWGLYGLVGDGQAGPHVYCGAVDREQARVVFDEAADMVLRSPSLKQRLEIVVSTTRIVYRQVGGFIHALSADAYQKEGLNASMVIIDELHAHRDRRWFDALWYAGRARSEPLMIILTTAGEELETICGEVYLRAKAIIENTVEDITMLPVIYEAPEGCAVDDREAWAAANPNLGVTVSVEDMESDAYDAQTSRTGESRFRRYCLNQWCAVAKRLLSIQRWDEAAEPFERDELLGEKCFGGLDLSSTKDLTSLCLAFPDDDGRYRAAWWFWCPEDAASIRQQQDGVPYLDWEKQGFIEFCPGDEIDYGWLRNRLREIFEDHDLQAVGVDHMFQGRQLTQECVSEGWPMVPFRQGFLSMAAPTSELDRLVGRRAILHGGHPIARWMAGNCVPEMDAAGNVKPSKRRSREKIDGIVALIMAIGVASDPKHQKKQSVYEERGLIAFGADGDLLGD